MSVLVYIALTVAVFLVGLAALRWLVQSAGDARIAFLLTLALTTALHFLGGRALSRWGL